MKIVSSISDDDPFIKSINHWLNGEYVSAVDVLLDSSSEKYDIAKIFTFFRFLSRNPLYLKAKSIHSCPVGKNHAKRERDLFLKAALSHLTAGCPIPAIIVLREVPKFDALKCSEKKTDAAENITNNSTDVNTMNYDWGMQEEMREEKLELDWSDDDSEDDTIDKMQVEEENVLEMVDQTKNDQFETEKEEEEEEATRFLLSKAVDCYLIQTYSFKKNISSLETVDSVISHLDCNVYESEKLVKDSKNWIHFLRGNLVEEHSLYQLALSLRESDANVTNVIPIVRLSARASLFFTTDIDLVRHHVERICSSIAKFAQLPSSGCRTNEIRADLAVLNKLVYRLIPCGFPADNLTPVENGGYIWPLTDNHTKASNLLAEFMVISVVALLTLCLADPDQIVETKVLARLLGEFFTFSVFLFVSEKYLLRVLSLTFN